ncbi:MAG: PadR family transcriptional regulator [Tissierellia bacterium]|nr:PadR family transcriptional regulator [Tissierellia bacterium]
MNPQMKKGLMEMCILHLISIKDLYGYDIMKLMSPYFPDVGESSFYAILRRLHKEGALESYLGEVSGGPPRKYYRIRAKGKLSLESDIEDWEKISKAVSEILATKEITIEE